MVETSSLVARQYKVGYVNPVKPNTAFSAVECLPLLPPSSCNTFPFPPRRARLNSPSPCPPAGGSPPLSPFPISSCFFFPLYVYLYNYFSSTCSGRRRYPACAISSAARHRPEALAPRQGDFADTDAAGRGVRGAGEAAVGGGSRGECGIADLPLGFMDHRCGLHNSATRAATSGGVALKV